tara:strand:- start:83 stop:358 length:276 start_codon:yes stop_codon:yes gene_type:complete
MTGRVIHKEVINTTAPITIKTNRAAFKFLSCAEQLENVSLWYETLSDEKFRTDTLQLMLIGTGFQVPNDLEYYGTVALECGLVWHIYGAWM